jgi:hypothetical protein
VSSRVGVRPNATNKIGDLYEIMQKYISGGACFVINLNDFRKLSKHFPSPRMRNHFYYATYGIMHNLMKNSNALGIDGPIDFVFDVNTMSKHVIPAWDSFKASGAVPPHRLGGVPVWKGLGGTK